MNDTLESVTLNGTSNQPETRHGARWLLHQLNPRRETSAAELDENKAALERHYVSRRELTTRQKVGTTLAGLIALVGSGAAIFGFADAMAFSGHTTDVVRDGSGIGVIPADSSTEDALLMGGGTTVALAAALTKRSIHMQPISQENTIAPEI